MNEDILRVLCTALLKVTEGESVHLSDSEWREPFDLDVATTDGGGFTIRVTYGEE
jgi:hypothetical protein